MDVPLSTISSLAVPPTPADLELGLGGSTAAGAGAGAATSPTFHSINTSTSSSSSSSSPTLHIRKEKEPEPQPIPAPVSPKLHSIRVSSPGSSTMSLSKPLKSYWDEYLHQLDENPVVTKSITAGVLSIVSDVIAQFMTGASLSTLNITSLWHQLLIGLTVRGPWVHYWYLFLEELFRRLGYGGHKASQSWGVAIGKMVLDQTTFGPVFNLLYFYVIGFLQNMPADVVRTKIANEFVPLMIANYKVWPLVNILNFKVIPPNLRVLFGNIVSIFWMVYVISATRGTK